MPNAAQQLVRDLGDDRPAVVAADRTWTRREVGERTRSTARWLVERGLSPGDRVVLLVPPGPWFPVALLAVVWAGGVPVLLDPGQGDGAWQARVAACQPRFFLVDPRIRRVWQVPGLPTALRWADLPIPPPPRDVVVLAMPTTATGDMETVERSPDDEALLVSTAGTTTQPKAVIHTHTTLGHFLNLARAAVGDLPTSSYLAELPQQILYGLVLGSACHTVKGRGPKRADAVLDRLARGGIEAWFGSPWTWVRWLDTERPFPPDLQTIVLGSAPITRPFLERLVERLPGHVHVRGMYGLTEAGPVCIFDGREKAGRHADGDWVGRPLAGTTVEVREGEIFVSSPALAVGYLGHEPLGGWLPTGDLGRVEEDGVVLLGRKKDMILRRGVNLYPGVLEPLLGAHSVLVGVYDNRAHDERVILVHEGAVPSVDLGEATPDHVLAVDALPRQGRQHKVNKQALRELARERFGIP